MEKIIEFFDRHEDLAYWTKIVALIVFAVGFVICFVLVTNAIISPITSRSYLDNLSNARTACLNAHGIFNEGMVNGKSSYWCTYPNNTGR